MIIWRGKGILVVAIVIAAFLVSLPLAFGVANAFGVAKENLAPVGIPITLFLAAFGNFFFARYLDDPAKRRTLVDPKTGQSFLFKDRSSLMLIPVRFWTYIFAVLAVLVLVGGLVSANRPTPSRGGAAAARVQTATAAPSALTFSFTSFCRAG